MIPIDSSIRYKFGIKEQDVDDKELGALVCIGWHSESEVISGGRQDAVLRHATPKIGKSSDGSIFWRISILTKVNEAIL